MAGITIGIDVGGTTIAAGLVGMMVWTALLFPGRAAGLSIAAALVLLVSTALFAVLATFAIAWTALLAAFVVLPAADRLTALDDARR